MTTRHPRAKRRSSAVTLPPLASVDKAERPRLARARLAALGAPLAYIVTGDHTGIAIVRRKTDDEPLPRHRGRRRVSDNIGTPGHPVMRARIATPLTPRVVRMQLLAAPAWLETDKAAAWLEERRAELPRLLTELDRLVDDEEAGALERYVGNEELLAGLVRIPQWLGERVDTSTHHVAPLPDAALEGLGWHARVAARLCAPSRAVLSVFVAQQLLRDGAPSSAQAAMKCCRVHGRHKTRAWWQAVRDAAVELVQLGY